MKKKATTGVKKISNKRRLKKATARVEPTFSTLVALYFGGWARLWQGGLRSKWGEEENEPWRAFLGGQTRLQRGDEVRAVCFCCRWHTTSSMIGGEYSCQHHALHLQTVPTSIFMQKLILPTENEVDISSLSKVGRLQIWMSYVFLYSSYRILSLHLVFLIFSWRRFGEE